MSLQLGSVAPDFEAESQSGKIHFADWAAGSWVVLFSHPADYTPVCTTELGSVARLQDEFKKRNTKTIALSVDPVDSHQGWIKDIEETQNVAVGYPVIADADQKVAKLYGMIHPETNAKLTVRSVFFIDPERKIRAVITYPPSTGRNFYEVLRVIDSLQLTDKFQVATPVDWKDGDDVVISPALTDASVLREKFPKGYKEIKPYLRITPQPNR